MSLMLGHEWQYACLYKCQYLIFFGPCSVCCCSLAGVYTEQWATSSLDEPWYSEGITGGLSI